MKRDDFLVEIHTEELPPKSLKKLGETFCQQIKDRLQKADLKFKDAKFFATPRRLAVLVSDLDATQPNQEVERKGPALAAAFDASGKPTPACVGFAKSCGVTPDELKKIKTPQGEWMAFKQKTQGKTVAELLPGIVNQALLALPIAKRMRWGASETEFVRPVHSVMMLYGKDIVDAEILGHKAGRVTRGHRFLSKKEINIKSPHTYESQLEKQGYVMADFEIRRQLVWEQAQALVKEKFSHDCHAIISDELWDEVTSLVEWPVALCGKFDESFLRVPREVLISAMQDHQRYFPVADDQHLLSNFVTISNIDSKDADRVIHGNERVLRARLSDAAFFYETDKHEKLENRLERLRHVVYQAKLGTLYDKAERISKLAEYISEKIGGDARLAKRAGWLAKADLVTNMVGEFPELQGIMGGYYAKNDGEHQEVVSAIKDQYTPRFAGESVLRKSERVTIAVALADRIDSLVGAFGINQLPSGDKDPYGLRRAAIGVLRYLIENQINLDLRDVLKQAERNYTVKLENTHTVEQVLEFINERLRAWYQEKGFAADIFAAVNAVQTVDLYDVDKRIKAVQAFKQLSEAEALSAANKRVSNILKTADVQDGKIDETLFEHEAEKMLAKKLAEKHKALQAVSDYKDNLIKLADLRQSVDSFFDHVMVMTDDKARQANRIRLLKELRQLFLQVADIALLQQNDANQTGAKKH